MFNIVIYIYIIIIPTGGLYSDDNKNVLIL